MEPSIQTIILQFFEENKKWWEQATVTCEQRAADLPTGERTEGSWPLYIENAQKNTRELLSSSAK